MIPKRSYYACSTRHLKANAQTRLSCLTHISERGSTFAVPLFTKLKIQCRCNNIRTKLTNTTRRNCRCNNIWLQMLNGLNNTRDTKRPYILRRLYYQILPPPELWLPLFVSRFGWYLVFSLG